MLKVRLLTETLQGDIDRHTDAKLMLNNIIGIIKHVGDEIPVLESINYDSFPNLDIFAVMENNNYETFSLFVRLLKPEIFYLRINFIDGEEGASANIESKEIIVANKKYKLCQTDIGYNFFIVVQEDTSLDILLQQIISNKKQTLLHELTHILDIHFTKLKNYKQHKVYHPDNNRKQYFESGLELNARWTAFLENLDYFLYTNYDKLQKDYKHFFVIAGNKLRISELTVKKQEKLKKKIKELFFNGPYTIPQHAAKELAEQIDDSYYVNHIKGKRIYHRLTKENQKIVKRILYDMGAPGIEYEDLEKE